MAVHSRSAFVLLSLGVLVAIGLGGCESVESVARAGMLTTSLLAVVLATAIAGVIDFGRGSR